MCGIAGFTSPRQTNECHRILQAMTDAIAHRGPDGDGQYLVKPEGTSTTVALGHRRLSIIDLHTGDQPLHIDEQRYSIVFNGEIYNYVELREELKALGATFNTQSDTEVLLRAYATWGAACLPKLRGMFSFAIWDSIEQVLFLARDPFGKKPLLYFRTGKDIVFASEFTALVEHPDFNNTINRNGLAQYLIWKYVPGTQTLIDGVVEVPPGHYAVWTPDDLRTGRYYSVPDQEIDPAKIREMNADTVAAFRAELTEAIRLRLRSDVPLGAFLSGGIDSSALVALMSQETGTSVKTFSIGFHEEEYSELWAARMIAEKYKTDHHELKIAPEDFLSSIEDVTWQRGAPLSEMADVPLYYLSKLTSEHVKVVLSGEGSDELMGGYPKHWGDLYVSKYHAALPAFADKGLDIAAKMIPYSYRRLAILMRVAKERRFLDRQAAWFGFMEHSAAMKLCPDVFKDYTPFDWPENREEDEDNLSRALRFDKTVWLPGTLLERGDRMTMAASIEGRMPFMDTKLCDFVSTLPQEAFLNGRTGKYILRQAMANDLPEEILNKPKVGFRVPVHEWLRGRLKDYAHDMLFSTQSNLADYCDPTQLKTLWDEHQSKTRNREKELWSLMSLEIFLRQLAWRSNKVQAKAS